MKIRVTGGSSYEKEQDGIVVESRIYSPPPVETPEGKVWNGVLGKFLDESEANYPFEVDENDTVFGEEHLAQWGEGDELAAALEGEEEPKGKKSDKTAQDSLYEALVEDELPKDKTLAEHDKERHPDGFNPETDSCKFREEMKKETETDRADEIRPEPAPKEDGGEEGGQKKPLVSPEEDKAYMEAVERGDMETAAKMVREVAGRAFPNTKVEYNGVPRVIFHGASEDFNVFDTEVGGDTSGVTGTGAFFTASNAIAREYSRNHGDGVVKRVFVNLENPRTLDAEGALYDNIYFPELKKQGKSKFYVTINNAFVCGDGQKGTLSYSFDTEHEAEEFRKNYSKMRPIDITGKSLRDIVGDDIEEMVDRFSDYIENKGDYISQTDKKKMIKGSSDMSTELYTPRFLSWFFTNTKEGREKFSGFTQRKEKGWSEADVVEEVKANNNVSTNDIALYERGRGIHDGVIVHHVIDVPEEMLSDIQDRMEEYGETTMYYDEQDYKSELVSSDVIVFSPKNIKSADPVTYDDNGNIIPLSRRFDDGDDIRGDVSGKSNQQNPQPVEKSDFEKAIDEVTALRDKLSDSEKQREKALREEHDFDKAKALSQEQDELKKKIEKVRKKSEKLFREEAKKGMPNTKVLGKDGLPLIVYHGTVSGDRFNQFADRPIFAFHREGLAAQYTSPRRDLWVSPSRTGRVMPMVMNLENPYIVDAGRKLWNNLRVDWSSKPVDTDDVVEYAKKNGYDGVIIKQVRDNMFDNDRTAGDEYIAFKPSQVKDTGATYKRVMGYGLAGEYDEIVDVVGMTTDDQGNTIPMSRRFDSGNDIRGDVSSGTKSGEFGEDFFSSVYPDRKQSYSSEFGTDEGEEKAQAEEAYSANFTKDGEYKSPLEGGRFSKEILEKARG